MYRKTALIRGGISNVLALSLLLGITGCDDNGSSSGDDQSLSAVVNARNLISTTGNVHLHLGDSRFDAYESVFHSVHVTDMETGETVFESNDVPAVDVINDEFIFSPIDESLEPWVAHHIKRDLAIDFSIRHIDGTSDRVQEILSIDQIVTFADLSTTAVQPGIAAKRHHHKKPQEVICSSGETIYQIICSFSGQNSSYALVNSVLVGHAIDLANQHIADKSLSGVSTVTEDTPIWLQAAGAYGGKVRVHTAGNNGTHGGRGGFAQTVTKVRDLPNRLNTVIYYYLANVGHHSYSGGSGGPSTIVTTQPITESITELDDVLLIAGGGGGGGWGGLHNTFPGGHGGDAFATSAADAFAAGEQYCIPCGSGGDVLRNSNGEVVIPYEPLGGDGAANGRDGLNGFGGNSGHEEGWFNFPELDLIVKEDGKGGMPTAHQSGDVHSGGGGGGVGGGGSGNPVQGGGGGGGGSYAKASTYSDSGAPISADDDMLKINVNAESTNRGWFRIVFNTASTGE